MARPKEYYGISTIWDRFRSCSIPVSVVHKKYLNEYLEAPHFHDFPQLWYCAEGNYLHKIDGVEYECSAGTLIIIPSGVKHSFLVSEISQCSLYQANLLFNLFDDFSNANELKCIIFTFLQSFSPELRFSPKPCITFHGEEKLFADNVFKTLAEYNASKKAHSASSYKILLRSLFSLSEFELPKKVLDRAKRFIKEKFIPLLRTVYYMNVNFSKKITREELVSLSGICQTDYFRYIKRVTGCTFSTYLQKIRVRHAIVLATFSPYSLSYIADICGFGDLTYMEDRIKKHSFGSHRLPSKMRKERKEYIRSFPFMIMTREDYEKIPDFFYKWD